METLLKNHWFWMGEIGLLTIAVCCLVANEMAKTTAKWWYRYALYATAVAALWCMGHPAVYGYPLPTPVYIFEFVSGGMFLCAYFQRRLGNGDPVDGKLSPMVQRIFVWGGIGGAVLLLIVGLIVAFKEQKAAAERLIVENRQHHKTEMQIIKADTAAKAELRLKLDTVRTDLKTAQAETAKAKAERALLLQQAKAIKHDTEVLKKQVKQADRNSQKMPPIKPIHAKDSLQDVPKKNFWRRIFGVTASADSSAGLASHR